MNLPTTTRICLLITLLVIRPDALLAEDQPQWGQQYTRNMVSAESGLPESFEPGRRSSSRRGEIDLPEDSGVRWVVPLGSQAHGSPIIAGGKVFVGTNNGYPRDQRLQEDRGVLMCFDEKTGEYLWQLTVPRLEDSKVKWGDWRLVGITSPPTVEGDRAYVVTNRCEVVCLDVNGMADGNDGPYTDEGRHMVLEGQTPLDIREKDADIVWVLTSSPKPRPNRTTARPAPSSCTATCSTSARPTASSGRTAAWPTRKRRR